MSEACKFLTTSSLFKRFMAAIVIINSILLVFRNPLDSENNMFLSGLEIGFFVAYALEMILKVTGFGLITYRDSYLRDPWNWLDFFVVIATLISLTGSGINNSSTKPIYFSSLKIISPMRTIKTIPKLKMLIRAIVDSLPALFDMLKVILLVFGCFAIIGVQLFQRSFSHKCVNLSTGHFDSSFNASKLCGGLVQCGEGLACAAYGDNPVSGMYSFDNIFKGYLTVFIITTLEGWSQAEYYLILTSSWWATLYVYAIVLFCSFILMNLALSIIVEKFTEMQNIRHGKTRTRIRNPSGKNHLTR